MIIDVTDSSMQGVAYWQAERFLVRLETPMVNVIFGYHESGVYNELARYTPVNGAVLIDVTDFVRAYPNRVMYITDTRVTRFVSATIAGRINPAGVLIPEREDNDFCAISAPSVMLAPFGSLQIAFEMWASAGEGYNFSSGRVKEIPGDTVQDLASSITLAHDTERVEFWHLNDYIYREVNIQPFSCGHNYACVEWVSFTGITRRHVFEISKAEVETGDVISLENILNEWTEIKGRVDGFTLRLENLDRYDLWYYSDLITSNRVRVTIDGTNWYDVHVNKDDYTLPESNAGRLSTLEIPIKFRKYDTI